MGSVCSISLPCDAMPTRCWDDCIRDQSTYVLLLEDHLFALTAASQELMVKRDDILTRVNLAEKQQSFKRLNEVQLWLSSVDSTETQVNILINNGPGEIDRLCLKGCCSRDFISSFKFGKSVSRKLKEVVSLINKGNFVEVAGREPASVVDVRPVEPTVGLEVTFAKVWSCLEGKNVGIVGLYGMGGVGKTMILKRVNNNFCNTPNDFDLVVWIVVSKDLKIEKIQEDIGKKIGFFNDVWNIQSCDDKAVDIYKVLSQNKFVLLLDDIWEPIDVIKVGIPDPSVQQNGSKIIFTARSEEICYQMKAQQRIKVECLAWDKAWELFQEKVGEDTISAHPDIPQLAETVARECGGLPLALITIGRAMAGKRAFQEWKHAITVLGRNVAEISGMGDKVFPILKFSYDNLQNDKIRSCFLYCALFPEDYNIPKDSLIDYWIGEGSLDGDRREAENEGYDFIGTLSRACLLEDAGSSVKMHDVIRDLALWIASEGGKAKGNYLVKAGAQLTKVPLAVAKCEHVQRMSLMANRIDYLCQTPKWKNLQSLILRENTLCMIPSDFFQFMTSLRVLDLSENQSLVTLPFGISKLVSLEYLNLSATELQQLPMELTALVNLKYLNLEHTPIVYKFPLQLMSGLSNLQVLRMDGYRYSDMVEDDIYLKINELLVDELKNLKQLVRLTIPIVSSFALQRFLSFEEVQNSSQALSLYTLSGLEELDVSSLTKMKYLENLSINQCEHLRELKIDCPQNPPNSVTIHCFDSLCNVRIDYCHKLRDLTWLILAPNLSSLIVSYCNGMEEIINESKSDEVATHIKPFDKLEVLNLKILPKLKSVCGKPLLFPRLREIVATSCPQLKKLPLYSYNGQDHKIVIKGYQSWWDELEWEDEATKTAFASTFVVLRDVTVVDLESSMYNF